MSVDRRPVSVAIIDDHPIATESLAARFAGAGFSVLAPAPSLETFDRDTTPGIVVCDLHLPGVSGAAAVADLHRRGLRVLATSGVATPDEVLDAVAAQARGFVEKTAPAQQFVAAVTAVAGGSFHVSARLAGFLLEDAHRRPLSRGEIGPGERNLLRGLAQGDLIDELRGEWGMTAAAVHDLLDRIFDAARRRRRLHRPSPREAEVMVLVGCRGMSHREAARAMNVKASVVADYLRTAKAKYVASHPDAPATIPPSTAAALWARELGFG
ncbi:response regulator [Frankia sp. CcI156]|uniref:Response regulator receiver protein n=1 Tax=Frankia casuarinae (strain DSM 45818 / CECT 9043 / HFP020203 / CcI3) TaxID=106370 RepID=Q2JG81_FRACC|nr:MULTISPECIES: response regulator [Frankia]ABD09711.1 response regulator receiver protein [Frankia casuarinae]ETA02306.1 response regulator containing a CheY receiver [Frankia sp. CcI6]EYT92955.1 response regulator containing a CheY-like receiver [Frankia casuarinae]KDA43340.1 response regulator containing a CheY-like receiver domain and an HTH DNA-binding domain [Frankia sp. BMG5.23]KFB03501.1 response regulator containing a CheY-like receiver domain and an HTH DNA-binding domain [Frankia s